MTTLEGYSHVSLRDSKTVHMITIHQTWCPFVNCKSYNMYNVYHTLYTKISWLTYHHNSSKQINKTPTLKSRSRTKQN